MAAASYVLYSPSCGTGNRIPAGKEGLRVAAEAERLPFRRCTAIPNG